MFFSQLSCTQWLIKKNPKRKLFASPFLPARRGPPAAPRPPGSETVRINMPARPPAGPVARPPTAQAPVPPAPSKAVYPAAKFSATANAPGVAQASASVLRRLRRPRLRPPELLRAQARKRKPPASAWRPSRAARPAAAVADEKNATVSDHARAGQANSPDPGQCRS